METDKTGTINPIGLAFSSQSERFYVVEDPGQTLSLAINTEVIAISPLADRKDSVQIAARIEDPLNMVFDNLNNRLLALQASTGRLIEIRENPSGNLDRTIVISHNIERLGIKEPRGLALDENSGTLFILDAVGLRIVRLHLGPGRNFTGGTVEVIELATSGLVSPQGIAFDPTSSHLHVFDLSNQHLYELNSRGQVVAARDLVPFDLRNPGAMVFAPSGDQTDDPSQMSLFLADGGLISGPGSDLNTPGNPDAQREASTLQQSSGQIIELSLVQPAEAAASSFTSTLVKTTDLSNISPPSPDSSGLAYLPAGNRLMVSDGEVEETAYNITHFQGANVWELSLAGSVIRTANISPVEPTDVPMSDEPTGVAWNPTNGHYYFSDDTGGPDVYDLNPGSDGLVGTSDDTWTSFSGSSYGLGDAEGIAYDSWNNTLFVVDGINAEVYQFTLAGTLISQFDVLKYGVVDPEAIEFNPDSGTLYVMSSDSSSPVMVETTTTGVLLQTIDISSANARAAAGLAYAPASNGSGESRFYIVDRGYDNNENGNLIDGKLYEMSAPPEGPTPTPSQTFTPTPTGQISDNSFYASFASGGTVGGVSFTDEDILHFDGQNWSMFFDGSDVVPGSTDLYAFSVLDADTILMAFSSIVTLNGLAVTPQDIVRFDATTLGANTAGAFSMYLDGSDVGLDTSGEKIDALSLLPLPDGRILISTVGNPSVPGISSPRDEDILAFSPTTLGNNTSGTWTLYFDGSDVGLAESSSEDIDALDIVGGNMYLSTAGTFSVSGASGAGEDVFICASASLGNVTACSYSSALFFDGSAWGLSGNSLDGLQLGSTNPGAPATSTATATHTPTQTRTPTNTPTSIFTPTQTRTPTNTPTPTNTGTPTSTFTLTNTPTLGPSPTATSTATNTPTPTNTNTSAPTFTPTPTSAVSDLIFADGFESGDFSAWTSASTAGGDLSVSPAAALVGSNGMQVLINDTSNMYVTDDTPNAEPRYRVRFTFDPNSLSMASGDSHNLFRAFMGTSTSVLQVAFRNSSGSYQLRVALLNDSSALMTTSWFTISDAPHSIELDWRAATGAGANDGGLTFWIDGVQLASLSGVDNDTWRIDRARLGALAAIGTNTSGTYFLDAFESRRQSYIGP